jgi:Mn-dependent DtxR family transcriptional regulator
MSCKKKQLNSDLIQKVFDFFKTHTDKSYRAWEIAEKLNLKKDEVSKAIKLLKEEWKIIWRCAYKLNLDND